MSLVIFFLAGALVIATIALASRLTSPRWEEVDPRAARRASRAKPGDYDYPTDYTMPDAPMFDTWSGSDSCDSGGSSSDSGGSSCDGRGGSSD